MKIGIDYWNTLSHHQEYFKMLINQNWTANPIHVISAIGKTRIGTIDGEVKKIVPYMHSKHIHEIVFDNPKQSPELKLAKCKQLGIDVFYDDRQDVVDLLNANGILAFLVPRKKRQTDIEAERK